MWGDNEPNPWLDTFPGASDGFSYLTAEVSAFDFDNDKKSAGSKKQQCPGLQNLGNTCFLNSVLQCLTYSAPFANTVFNCRHKASCRVEGFCAMCGVEDHLKAVGLSLGETVAPHYFVNNLSNISKSFVLGGQQDAHECLIFLLEMVQKSCAFSDVERSFVSDIFMGQLRSQVQCRSCSQISDSMEDFLGLSLEIETCSTLVEALQKFTVVEILEDAESNGKTSCTNCRTSSVRSKRLNFDKTPIVLAVHLKRFRVSKSFPVKISKELKYGLSLDLKPYISKAANVKSFQEGHFNYTLYAVLVHSGSSAAFGHYVCYVKTSPGIWHWMNDSQVSTVSEEVVLRQEAYILFYIRQDLEDLPVDIYPEMTDMALMAPACNVRKMVCTDQTVVSCQSEVIDDTFKAKADDVFQHEESVSSDTGESMSVITRIDHMVCDNFHGTKTVGASIIEPCTTMQNGKRVGAMKLAHTKRLKKEPLISSKAARKRKQSGDGKAGIFDSNGQLRNVRAQNFFSQVDAGSGSETAAEKLVETSSWIEEYEPAGSQKLHKDRVTMPDAGSFIKYRRRTQ